MIFGGWRLISNDLEAYITGKAKLRSPCSRHPAFRSVSMPSMEIFKQQPQEYIDMVRGTQKQTAGLGEKGGRNLEGSIYKMSFSNIKRFPTIAQSGDWEKMKKTWTFTPKQMFSGICAGELPSEIYYFLSSGFTYSILFDRDSISQRLFFPRPVGKCDSMPDWGENIVP